MSDWTPWAEGLVTAAHRVGRTDKTVADFPKPRQRWNDADAIDGRDVDTFADPDEAVRAGNRYERFMGF